MMLTGSVQTAIAHSTMWWRNWTSTLFPRHWWLASRGLTRCVIEVFTDCVSYPYVHSHSEICYNLNFTSSYRSQALELCIACLTLNLCNINDKCAHLHSTVSVCAQRPDVWIKVLVPIPLCFHRLTIPPVVELLSSSWAPWWTSQSTTWTWHLTSNKQLIWLHRTGRSWRDWASRRPQN